MLLTTSATESARGRQQGEYHKPHLPLLFRADATAAGVAAAAGHASGSQRKSTAAPSADSGLELRGEESSR